MTTGGTQGFKHMNKGKESKIHDKEMHSNNAQVTVRTRDLGCMHNSEGR